MQCTSNYPTPYKNVNLRVLQKMRDEFDIPVGLSDHYTGNYACFGAIALGPVWLKNILLYFDSYPG